MRWLFVSAAVLGLIAMEVLRVYFIMPFPGSQKNETLEWAYLISRNVVYLRLAGFVLLIYPIRKILTNGGGGAPKVILAVFLTTYALVFYFFNYRLSADKMFLNLENKAFSSMGRGIVDPDQLILGVSLGGESKAYPLEIIGYHHQVRDSVGGEPVMVTYCTVCRTARVYSPWVGGRYETFRLVGMDHFNAMFEDAKTGSWWRQVNGEAVVGPLKGSKLNELPSEQMSLSSWIKVHPETKILQPDKKFSHEYRGLEGYGAGRRSGNLERRDAHSWMDKSWVIGIQIGKIAKAYDWNDFQRIKVISDEIDGVPIVLVANPDTVSLHAYSRVLVNERIDFKLSNEGIGLTDIRTGSSWNWNGKCEEGVYKGKALVPLQAYQEYWHSWRTFHPQTSRYTSR